MTDPLKVGGFHYTARLYNQDGSLAEQWEDDNLIPAAGLSFLLQAPFGDVAPIGAWYCGLFRGNYLPTSATTSADIPTNMQEFVSYSEATRPLWDRAFDGVATMDNSAVKAAFNVTADATLYGAFLASVATKGTGTGTLLSVVRFTTPKPVSTGQRLELLAGITYIPTNVV